MGTEPRCAFCNRHHKLIDKQRMCTECRVQFKKAVENITSNATKNIDKRSHHGG